MRRNIGNKLWGILLICVGIGFAGNALNWWDFELFFDGWWTLFIIIPCVINMVQAGVHVGNIIGVGIGLIMLAEAQDILPISLYKLAWPALIIIAGIAILFQRPRYSTYTNNGGATWNNNSVNYSTADTTWTRDSSTTGSSSYGKDSYSRNYSSPDAFVVLGSVTAHFSGMEFNKGSCLAVLGGITYDLRGAKITQDVQLDATAVFGGIDVLVDETVQVRYTSVPILGGVDCKVPPRDPSMPTVFINCVSLCGGIDIK